MIFYLKQYIIDRMTCRQIWLYFFIVHGKVFIFSINVISTLSGLTYKNIEKMHPRK